MTDFVVYGSQLSPFVRKVEAVLRHQDAAYDFENIDIMDMPDWYVEISPARRIPVLRDRSIAEQGIPGTIADSSAICLYLDRKLNAGLYGRTAFEAGRAAWLEEYCDTELSHPLGMKLFRPILFPRLAGKESDVEMARKTYQEILPRHFDYLEGVLDGNQFFVGSSYSIADIAVSAQLTQLDLVAGLPDASRWPGLARHTNEIKSRPGFSENLATASMMLRRVLPQKLNLA